MIKKNLLLRIYRNLYLITFCCESFITLTYAKCLIVFLSHKRWGFQTSYFQCETLKNNITASYKEILAIRRTITWISKYLPWPSKCLDQALTAQRMLTRRKLPNTLYFGMRKNEGNKWVAHAWVRCGNQWVTGYQRNMDYAVVATYARFT